MDRYAGRQGEQLWLWPNQVAPGSESLSLIPRLVERSQNLERPDRAAMGTIAPVLTVFRPKHPNGAALLVCPGGAYQRVVLDKEGTDLVPALVDVLGLTLFILQYRLPGDGHVQGADAPLADAQRAMRLIRAQAPRYELDPQRIGVMGFSAGGHVAASLACKYAQVVAAPVDATDALNARPDFLVLGYPVISMNSAIEHVNSRQELLDANRVVAWQDYSLEMQVHAAMPPAWIMHALDDSAVLPAHSERFYQALCAQNVAAQLHLFYQGGHGYGVRGTKGLDCAVWPQLLEYWLRQQQVIE